MKNHEKPWKNMKNQPGAMKNHENRPGTMTTQPGAMKNHENWPGSRSKSWFETVGQSAHFLWQTAPIIYRSHVSYVSVVPLILDFQSNFPLFFCVCILLDFRAISPHKTRLYHGHGGLGGFGGHGGHGGLGGLGGHFHANRSQDGSTSRRLLQRILNSRQDG